MFLVVIHVGEQTVVQSRYTKKGCMNLIDAYRFVCPERIKGWIYQGGRYEEVR